MDRLSIPLNLLPVGCTARVKEIKLKEYKEEDAGFRTCYRH